MRGWSGPDHACRVRLPTRGCKTLSSAVCMPDLTVQEYMEESSHNGDSPFTVNGVWGRATCSSYRVHLPTSPPHHITTSPHHHLTTSPNRFFDENVDILDEQVDMLEMFDKYKQLSECSESVSPYAKRLWASSNVGKSNV